MISMIILWLLLTVLFCFVIHDTLARVERRKKDKQVEKMVQQALQSRISLCCNELAEPHTSNYTCKKCWRFTKVRMIFDVDDFVKMCDDDC